MEATPPNPRKRTSPTPEPPPRRGKDSRLGQKKPGTQPDLQRYGLPPRTLRCGNCGQENSVFIDKAEPYGGYCCGCYIGDAEKHRGDADHRVKVAKSEWEKSKRAAEKKGAAELERRENVANQASGISRGVNDGSGTSELFKNAIVVPASKITKFKMPADLVRMALAEIQEAACKAAQFAKEHPSTQHVLKPGGNADAPQHDVGPVLLEIISQPSDARKLVSDAGLVEYVMSPDNEISGRAKRHAARMEAYPAIMRIRQLLWEHLRPADEDAAPPELQWGHAAAFLPRSSKNLASFLDGDDAWKRDDEVFPTYRMHHDKKLLWKKMDPSCSVDHGIASVTLYGTAEIFVGIAGCKALQKDRCEHCLLQTPVKANDAYAIHSTTMHAVNSSNNRIALVFRGLNYERYVPLDPNAYGT